jgi:hypothetical protein
VSCGYRILAQSRQAFPALFGTCSREVDYSHRFMSATIREQCRLPGRLSATLFSDSLWRPTSAGCAPARPGSPEAGPYSLRVPVPHGWLRLRCRPTDGWETAEHVVLHRESLSCPQ